MKTRLSPVLVFLTVFLLAITVKLLVIDILYVAGPSMSPVITPGTLVAEFRLEWGIPVPFKNAYFTRWGTPTAGDIVIYPWQGRLVVKRCVAGPGEKLVFSDEKGYSVRSGAREIPLNREQYHKMKNVQQVPDGMIFAVGDNMAESHDSRDYGFVSVDSIRGTVLWK